jgi:hypothetical protein
MSQFVGGAKLAVAGAALIFGFTLAGSASAQSVQKQCSEKYEAAKKANTLNGEKWNEFYKQCAAELKGATPAATPAPAPGATPAPAPAAEKPKPTTPAPAATGPIMFPKAIDPKYANLSPHLGRMKTCDDQYKANKATNSNGGLKWTEKGGGYYSLCNKQLKGG